jgi:membrane-bound metal-dependent hydrolase YbcI (DUF457 family)
LTVFLGHFAAALAAKKLTPYTSLGTLIFAGELADLLWPSLLLRGAERVRIVPEHPPLLRLEFVSYPWSHSLLMLAVWAALLAALYAFFRCHPRGTLVVAALVVSHWVLDAASHRPDMPLVPWGGPLVGLGLWYSQAATLAVEGLLLGLGTWLYAAHTEPVNTIGRYAFGTFIVGLLVLYVASLVGPAPPSVDVLAWSTQGLWLFVILGYWLDRHRFALRQW